MKLFDSLLFFIAGGLLGIFGYSYYFDGKPKRDPMPDNKQQIILKQINEVTKLITLEGEFSNIHEYKDYFWSDVSMFSKQAIVRVNATVSLGYDLQKATFEPDSIRKVIVVKNLPDPEILAIDHDLDYYDISEGMFNAFNEEELTSIGDVAKQKLRKAVENSELMDKARARGLETLEIIRILVEASGWTLEIEKPEPLQDSLRKVKAPVPEINLDSVKINPLKPSEEKKDTTGVLLG